MKTLILEHPRLKSEDHFNDIANTPLWSCLLGGYATAILEKAGYHVIYLDACALNLNFVQTEKKILKENPQILAVNGVYFWEETAALFILFQKLRKHGYTGHINLFGFFPTLHNETILQQVSEVDSIILGECEFTLLELTRALNNSESWQDIDGLASRHKIPPFKQRKPEKNLDQLPFPTRILQGLKTPAILASRGCYNHCSFCPIPSFYNQGPLWRGRSPQNVIAEIVQLQKQGFTDFYFVDPNFIGPGIEGIKRTMELLQLLKPLKITFGMETRPNDLNEEIMKMLLKAGLTSLLLGIESGSRGGLKSLNKHCTVDISQRALAICREHRIEPEVGFLMFTPDTSLQNLMENLTFLKQQKLLDRLDRTANLLCHRQIILSGTKGYNEYCHQNRLSPDGFMGFEGKVAFTDPKVRWVASVIIPLCLWLLRLTGEKTSPLYFETAGNYNHFASVNDYLVSSFEHTIKTANQLNPPQPDKYCSKMLEELETLITTSPFLPKIH